MAMCSFLLGPASPVFLLTTERVHRLHLFTHPLMVPPECRSVPQQIEYWARLGKCALDNPDLPIEFVRDVLISKLSDRSLAEAFELEGGRA
jgi:hypothetical protein